MKLPASLEDRLRLAGIAILAGLGVELLTIFWIHPLSFMFFAGPGVMLMGAGVLFYLYSLLTR